MQHLVHITNNKTRHNARQTEYLKNERAKRALDFFHIPTLSNYSNQGTKPETPAEFKRNRECTMRAAAAVDTINYKIIGK